jgi:4-carboxymuconolactone decarboxylase
MPLPHPAAARKRRGLVTAREWSQDCEWYVHQPIALKAGISKDIADAIADGRRPTAMSADEEIVHDSRSSCKGTNACPFRQEGLVDMTGISNPR